nr:transposase [Salinarchaeum sp. IM2453]
MLSSNLLSKGRALLLTRQQFACQDCGYEANADYNAAKNIANRYCGYIHRGQKSRGGWASSQLALKSGTLNVNGEYTPAELPG